MKRVEDYIRTIPNFPEPGIMFRDVTTLLLDPEGFKLAIDKMQAALDGLDFDLLAGTESRGFIFGTPLAYNLNKPFVLVRKKGKLPAATLDEEYDLEYGKAAISIHTDAIKQGQRVVLVDDLIATGGTIGAAARLVERAGGKVVKMLFLMELAGLNGRANLSDYDVTSIVTYPGK